MSFTPSPVTPNPPSAVLRSATPPPLYSTAGLAGGQVSQEEPSSHLAPSSSSFSRRSLDKSSSPIDQSNEALILDGSLPEAVNLESSMPSVMAPAPVDSRPRAQTPSTRSLRSVPSNSATLFMPDTSHSISGLSSDNTVTPLHLLGDQADTVDCPFCRRRVETRIKKNASAATHVAATGLFLTTIGGVVAPYARHWKCHISHFCTNCGKKVAVRRNGSDEMKVLGTPDHLRQISRFPAATVPSKKK